MQMQSGGTVCILHPTIHSIQQQQHQQPPSVRDNRVFLFHEPFSVKRAENRSHVEIQSDLLGVHIVYRLLVTQPRAIIFYFSQKALSSRVG